MSTVRFYTDRRYDRVGNYCNEFEFFILFFYEYSLSSNVIIGNLNLSDRFEIWLKYSSDINV